MKCTHVKLSGVLTVAGLTVSTKRYIPGPGIDLNERAKDGGGG